MKFDRDYYGGFYKTAPGHIPFKWLGNPGYFFTYYGDVFWGTPVVPDGKTNGPFFVLPNSHIKQIWDQKITPTYENLKRLGPEVAHESVIAHWEPNRDLYKPTLGVPDKEPHTLIGNPIHKMIVFGAGASACCVSPNGKDKLQNHAFKPPLGFDIFSERFDTYIKQFKGAFNAVTFYEQAQKNIEEFYEDEWSVVLNNYRPDITARHLNIQFYLQELFTDISENIHSDLFRYNLYKLFAGKLHDYLRNHQQVKDRLNAQVALVSFNYDTLLDKALVDEFKFTLNTLNDYTNNELKDFLLFKPHGSCNWGWPLDAQNMPYDFHPATAQKDLANYLFEEEVTPGSLYFEWMGDDMICATSYGTELDTDVMFGKYTPNKNKIELMQAGKPYIPALLLPYRDKDQLLLKYKQQSHLEYCMENMEELIVIGWKGNEKVFNKKLNKKAKNLKRLVIVNPDPDTVINNLSPYLPNIQNLEIHRVSTFDEYVTNFMK